MKKIILKSLVVLSILIVMVLSITLNTSKIAQSKDVTIANLTALNTASAEGGDWCIWCTNEIVIICWSNPYYSGRRVAEGPCY